jgi:hypothetical protein
MNKCVLAIASILLAFHVYGQQSELLIGDASKYRSLVLTNCTIDNQHNLYLLANTLSFDTAYGMLMPSVALGNTVIKIGKGGETIWSKYLPSDYPGNSSILLEDSLFIAHGIGIGYNICSTIPDTVYRISNVNAFYKTPVSTDSPTDVLLPYGANCGENTILSSYFQRDEFHYLYANNVHNPGSSSPRFFSAKTNRSLSNTESTEVVALYKFVDSTNYLIGIYRDTMANTFLIHDRYGVHVFTDEWQEIRYLDLRIAYDNLHSVGEANISYNRDYYAIAISAILTGGVSAKDLLIFSKEGRLISQKKYGALPKIALDENNRLVSAETIDTLDTEAHPVIIKEMNLLQDVLSEKHVGRPASEATYVAINNDEVIVAGTIYYRVNTAPSPFELYLYKSKLTNNADNACRQAHFYPNPAANTLSVVCGASTSESSIAIYDLTGRSVIQQSFAKQAIDIDVSTFPKAQYIIKLTNSAGNCVTRFTKL